MAEARKHSRWVDGWYARGDKGGASDTLLLLAEERVYFARLLGVPTVSLQPYAGIARRSRRFSVVCVCVWWGTWRDGGLGIVRQRRACD